MKKTQWISVFKNIRGTLVSYISVAVFVALAIGIYVGISWGSDSLARSAERIVMEEGNLADMEAVFPYGFGEDAVEAVSRLPGVTAAEGTCRSYGTLKANEKFFYCVIHQIPGALDCFVDTEGTLPEGKNEIALERSWANSHDIKIGDTVSLSGDFARSFTVTALVDSPLYSSGRYGVSLENEITLDTAVYLARENWQESAGYSAIRIRCDDLRGLAVLQEDYTEKSKEIQKDIAQCLAPYVQERCRLLSMSMVVIACDVTFLSAAQNIGLCVYNTMGVSTANAQLFVAGLFLLVGLLVCYSAISRLAFDQSIQIGTMKALGLRKREITLGYVIYSLSAALLGCILALPLGLLIGKMFLLILMKNSPGSPTIFKDFVPYLIISGAALLLILFATLFACRRVLKKRAVTLLAGRVPSQGKIRFFERLKIWEKSSLLAKTMVNNFLNDKRRVLGTMIGITCSSGLIVMALCLNFNAKQGFRIQLEEHYAFDTLVNFDTGNPQAQETVEAAIADLGLDCLASYYGQCLVDTAGKDKCIAKLFVPSDMEAFRDYYHLTPVTRSDVTPYEGIWMNCGYLNSNGGEDTQTVTAHLGTGETVKFPLTGFFKDYTFSGELIMTPEAYETNTGRKWQPNCFLVSRGEMEAQDLTAKLSTVEGVVSVRDFTAMVQGDFDLYNLMILAIMSISVFVAVFMTFLVVLNLLTMFVSEKKKELIVLRINGYTVKDARRYLAVDTVLLTVISILLSFPLGTVAGNFILKSLECSMLYLHKGISLIACGISGLCAATLVFFAARAAMKPIKQLRLSDINK